LRLFAVLGELAGAAGDQFRFSENREKKFSVPSGSRRTSNHRARSISVLRESRTETNITSKFSENLETVQNGHFAVLREPGM
jgi:hypothetical protein